MAAREPFSPIAAARLRVLVLPVHRIKRSRFMTFFNALAAISEVRLGDVSTDPRPDRNMFSPLHFPDGVLLYDFTISEPPQNHLVLSPFELFREPLVVLGLADWQNETSSTELSNGRQSIALNDFETIIGNLREKYPRILVHNVLLFDSPGGIANDGAVEGLIHVPPAEQRTTTSMKTIVCDITSKLLAEMTSLARSIQALPTITSPAQSPKGLNGLPISQRFRDATLVRADSLNAGRPRSASPAIGDGIHSHRMSMPVVTSRASPASTPTGGSRPTSPDFGLTKPPARTFEEITANSEVEQQKSADARSTSQDRLSIHGFGSGSFDEWNRNKGQCRIGIVIAGLYLQAGRWYDAMKELVDNAIKARSLSDHLWHAKALENILVCMLLLTWLRLEFQIPPICYPIPDRSSSSRTTQSTPAASTTDVSSAGGSSTSRSTHLQALARVIPDLANMILSIYARPLAQTLPELAFAESTIRLAKTLTAIHLAGGVLNDDVLQHIVHGANLNAQGPPPGACRLTITPSRPSIEVLLSKAFPEAGEASDLPPLDRIVIVAGIASVLSALGLQRKKSMMIKEYIDVLTAAINENKRIGAAQAGVHPTVSLPAFTGDFDPQKFAPADHSQSENGLEEFLNTLCHVHGIPEAKWSEDVGFAALRSDATNGMDEDTKGPPQEGNVNTTPLSDQLVGNFILRSFGSINVKADILRSCIQLCDAISDIDGLLHYAAALLRTSGPGIAVSFDNGDSLISLSREEQISLLNLINRTTADSKLVGIHAEAEFWDDFLVRGLYVLGSAPSLAVRRQKQSDLVKTKSKLRPESTFKMVHDPFATKEVEEKDEPLVANEEREFVVVLQNPYEFEVQIEHIKILSDTMVVASSKHDILLRPSRTQSFSVTGRVLKSGTIRVDACMVKIRGCRERRFSIFSENWAPAADAKIKNHGLLKFRSMKSKPESDESTSSQVNQTAHPPFPSPSIITLSVIPDQPRLVVFEKPTAQSALMLLEGERKKISVTLHNTSDTVAADFLHIAFQDTASRIMEEAVAKNKTLSPPELYEFEHQLLRRPAVRRCEESSPSIAPLETKTFDFEVLGKPGLAHANIVFHYANIATAHTDDNNIFFSRQISVSYAITVNASIQLHRFDVLPFSGGLWRTNDVASSDDDQSANHICATKAHRDLTKHIQVVSQSTSADEWCLAALDLRNGWPAPIHASARLEPLDDMADRKATLPSQTVQELIQPGHVSRIVLLVPRIYLRNRHRRIKPINPENERQFVVSTATEPEAEIMTRELFWYREAVLNMLRGSWTVDGNDRAGDIDVRALRLNSRMLDILRLDDLAVEFQVLDAKEDRPAAQSRSTRSTFNVRVEEDLVFRVKIKNRSDKTIFPLLRIRPSWAHQPSDQALDLAKRLTWDGVLQRQLDPVGAGETTFADTPLCVTCSGELEIGASIEEYRLCKSAAEEEKEVGRPGRGPALTPDSIADIQGRRTWTANQPCRIIAADN